MVPNKKIKILAIVSVALLSVLMAFGFFTYNRKAGHDEGKFSTERVVEDLEVISKEHHSIEHPAERERVRQYLFDQLIKMGGTPQIYRYDSIKSKFGGTFDIGNIYCQFDPVGKYAESYILLVAHIDSRFAQQVRDRVVYSYGAADDGYGLGVILELTRGAQKYKSDWKQGIKILFTDGEEHEMDGMREALERDNHLFDNVGLVVNVEARGVKGPVLLFETSGGNKKLMEFYTDYARYPYTYSLTSVVYDVMPNLSDFTYAGTLFPGINISAIDNIDYYHTDKDNIDNINVNTIGHYGAQLQPLLEEFLTGEYSDPDYFRADEDAVVFTIPSLSTFEFSKGGYILFNALVFFLFALVFSIYILLGRISPVNVLKSALRLLLVSAAVLAAGTGVAFAAAKIVGTPFSVVATKFVPGDTAISIAMILLMAFIYVVRYLAARKKDKFYLFEHLFGALLLMLFFSVILLCTVGENFFFSVPVAIALVALLLHTIVYMNIFSVVAMGCVSVLGLSFLYNLLTALTIGSLGIVMFVALFYIVIVTTILR